MAPPILLVKDPFSSLAGIATGRGMENWLRMQQEFLTSMFRKLWKFWRLTSMRVGWVRSSFLTLISKYVSTCPPFIWNLISSCFLWVYINWTSRQVYQLDK